VGSTRLEHLPLFLVSGWVLSVHNSNSPTPHVCTLLWRLSCVCVVSDWHRLRWSVLHVLWYLRSFWVRHLPGRHAPSLNPQQTRYLHQRIYSILRQHLYHRVSNTKLSNHLSRSKVMAPSISISSAVFHVIYKSRSLVQQRNTLFVGMTKAVPLWNRSA